MRELDGDLLAFLATVDCIPASEQSILPLLYQETVRICSENREGNFLVVGNDAAAALMLAWLIRSKTMQPRKLFIPAVIYRQYAAAFEQLGRGVWIRPVDGLLQEAGDARNWLGMVQLLYHDGAVGTPSLEELFQLLSSQLLAGAAIVAERGAAGRREQLNHQSRCVLVENDSVLLTWTGVLNVNPSIDIDLIEEFNQDDPVKAGIPTMMSLNERFQLYYTVRCLLPKARKLLRFVEVGSFAGGTFYEASMALKRMQIPHQGVAVEPFPGETFYKVMDFLKENSLHMEMKSHEAAARLADMFEYGSLPVFMLIDGDHSYDAVCQDIQDYYSMLAPGGIIMFHDYLPPLDDQNRAFVIDRKGNDEPSIGEACRELLERDQGLVPIDLPLLFPENPCQTLAYQPIIPGLHSTLRAYRKP